MIVASHTGTTLRDHDSFTFQLGEVVTIRQSRGEMSLAESVSRSWKTTGGVWVPNKNLAFVRSFKKVQKWGGEKHIAIDAGDYGADYDFDSTGEFKLRATDGRESIALRGHLYKSKNILWARINGENGRYPNAESVFVVLPNGKLCLQPFEDCEPRPQPRGPRDAAR